MATLPSHKPPKTKVTPNTHLQFPLAGIYRIVLHTNLLLQIAHALLVRLRYGPLMVTENGDGTVRSVIR